MENPTKREMRASGSFVRFLLARLRLCFLNESTTRWSRVRPSARLGPSSPSSSPSPLATASLIAVTIARRARRCARTPGGSAWARATSISNARARSRPARAEESTRRTCARGDEDEDGDEDDARCEHDATADAFVELIARIVATNEGEVVSEGGLREGLVRSLNFFCLDFEEGEKHNYSNHSAAISEREMKPDAASSASCATSSMPYPPHGSIGVFVADAPRRRGVAFSTYLVTPDFATLYRRSCTDAPF